MGNVVEFRRVEPLMKVGDTFTMHAPVYRKWWQFWKPKIVAYRWQKFVVVSDVTA